MSNLINLNLIFNKEKLVINSPVNSFLSVILFCSVYRINSWYDYYFFNCYYYYYYSVFVKTIKFCVLYLLRVQESMESKNSVKFFELSQLIFPKF